MHSPENSSHDARKAKNEKIREAILRKWTDPAYAERAVAGMRARAAEHPRVGHVHTEVTKRKISEARGGISLAVYPLLVRGGDIDEVAQITQLEHTQVRDAVSNLCRSGKLPRPTKEEQSRARSIFQTGKKAGQHGRVYSFHEQQSIAIAKDMHRKDMIKEDVSNWNALHSLYQRHERDVPDNFSDKLRLEFFLVANAFYIARGDARLLTHYYELGDGVDGEWFQSTLHDDELFITSSLEYDFARFAKQPAVNDRL